MGEKETVQFSIRGPIPVQSLDGEKVKKIGCSIIDLNFNQPSQFGELVFTNFYTAFISVYVIKRQAASKSALPKDPFTNCDRLTPQNRMTPDPDDWSLKGRSRKPHSSGNTRGKNVNGSLAFDVTDKPWECSVHLKILMRLPHFEDGSQDVFSIQATESLVEWRDVSVMRLVIHQPSSVWKKFSVDDINVFRNLPKRGFSHQTDDAVNPAKDGWLSVLKGNTKRMLNGQLVEAEPEKQESRKGSS